jgi:lysine 6-dehydrogenase
MRISVVGAGMMGSAIAWDLARSSDVDELKVADISSSRLSTLEQKLGDKAAFSRFDVTNPAKLERFLRGCDATVSALPHGAVHPVDVAAIGCGAKMVNIAFEDEQMRLDRKARKNGSVLIPGCGLAPGLSNILVAEGTRGLESAEGHVYVGGLPQDPEPPLWYRLVFSVKGLVREYVSARVLRDGKVLDVRPFEEVERVRFPKPVGTLEAFFTDGLGSSIFSLAHLRQLDERTLRYPGHAERIKFLLDAGFFGSEKVSVDGLDVSPVDVSGAVLQRLLTRGDPKDLTIMRVATAGVQAGELVKTTFDLVDRYDQANGISSMGRTTGFTAAIVTRMLGRGDITGTGVLPPETTLEARDVARLLTELSSKGVIVKRRGSFRPAGSLAS